MTPARKAALQWFHDKGAVTPCEYIAEGSPGARMAHTMRYAGEITGTDGGYVLTDLGRRRLNGDDV